MRNDGEVYKSVVAKVSSGAAKREDAEIRERELLVVLAKWATGSPPWPVPLMNFPCYPRGQHTEVNGAVGSGESRAVGCDES